MFDRSFFSFLPVSLRAIRNLRTNFFFLFFSKKNEKERAFDGCRWMILTNSVFLYFYSCKQVTLDCSVSNISLGLLLKPGEDGRPVVRTVRPGGKALGKVQVGDCILATSYVELGNVSDQSWGSVRHGWCDTAEVSYDQANAAMTTNTNKISMILDSDYKPASGPKAVTSTNSEDAKAWAKQKAAELRAKRSR